MNRLFTAAAAVAAAALLGRVSSAAHADTFSAHCVFDGTKDITLVINADDANNWATITVNDKTVVNGTNKQAVDANGMGVGHYIYENNTATVWYVAPDTTPHTRAPCG